MDVVSPATVNSQLSQGKEEYKKRQKKARHTNLETGSTAKRKYYYYYYTRKLFFFCLLLSSV